MPPPPLPLRTLLRDLLPQQRRGLGARPRLLQDAPGPVPGPRARAGVPRLRRLPGGPGHGEDGERERPGGLPLRRRGPALARRRDPRPRPVHRLRARRAPRVDVPRLRAHPRGPVHLGDGDLRVLPRADPREPRRRALQQQGADGRRQIVAPHCARKTGQGGALEPRQDVVRHVQSAKADGQPGAHAPQHEPAHGRRRLRAADAPVLRAARLLLRRPQGPRLGLRQAPLPPLRRLRRRGRRSRAEGAGGGGARGLRRRGPEAPPEDGRPPPVSGRA
mmetsp:Transcript_14632/g.38813  ORF Transcript_14632/g.38813 Transcript_14632/m.38813 type:complete len:276 (-) Transcript_14632:45-872(-)